jgi:ABC-type multidrug transport system fused ATPase/permease subunit
MSTAFAERERDRRPLDVELLTGGTHPAEAVHDGVIEAMAERDIDIADRTPREIAAETLRTCDYVATMGCSTLDLGDVEGVDVRDWELAALRRQISIIEQDVFLFSRKVTENIAFGDPGATAEEIEAAARAAQAHDFIMTFSDGYETVIGERGTTLSGGQRQRLAIARAFLTEPRILVLDDSTSAVDSATEDRIQQAIARAAERQTTILITHRLSQIRWADKVVLLRRGRLVAVGDHETLMSEHAGYRRIFEQYR